jgi:LuxR family maltose regulon positive regulatory protein
MPAPILATKLYVPSPRDKAVPRSRLIERLNEGALQINLISAPAGFGKTTLLSGWRLPLTPPPAREIRVAMLMRR